MNKSENKNKFILHFYKGKSYALSIEGIEHKVKMVKVFFQVKRFVEIPIQKNNVEFLDITSSFDIDLDILYQFFKLHYPNLAELRKTLNKIIDNYGENLPEGEYLGSLTIDDLSIYAKFREFMEDIAKIRDDKINL